MLKDILTILLWIIIAVMVLLFYYNTDFIMRIISLRRGSLYHSWMKSRKAHWLRSFVETQTLGRSRRMSSDMGEYFQGQQWHQTFATLEFEVNIIICFVLFLSINFWMNKKWNHIDCAPLELMINDRLQLKGK